MQAKNRHSKKASRFSAKLPREALIEAIVAVWRLQRLSTQQRNKEQKRIQASLEASRGSASQYFPHHQAKIERTGMNEQPFDDIVLPPQMGSSHGSGFVHVGEASFDSLATLAQQALSGSPLIRRRF